MITRKWIASGFVLAIAVTGVTAGVFMAPKNAVGEETPPYITDVSNRLDNHEARITNNESDIQALQDSTGTAPSAHVSVPSSAPTSGAVQQTNTNTVVTEPTVAPTPTPKTVVRRLQMNPWNNGCTIRTEYSDGTYTEAQSGNSTHTGLCYYQNSTWQPEYPYEIK